MSSLRLKVVTLGNADVGKSCLIKRYCEKRFVSKYTGTIGVDFGVSSVDYDGSVVKLNFFDLSGEQGYHEVRCEFYADTQAILLVFDVTVPASFQALDTWIEELRCNLPESQSLDDILVFVCANKVDLPKRAVKEGVARMWSESHGFHYFETSCETGQNVTEVFSKLIELGVSLARAGFISAQGKTKQTFSQADLDEVLRVERSGSAFEMLGLQPNASKDDVNREYRRLATKLHPDKNKAPGSDAAFKAITAAKASLLGGRPESGLS